MEEKVRNAQLYLCPSQILEQRGRRKTVQLLKGSLTPRNETVGKTTGEDGKREDVSGRKKEKEGVLL